MEELPQRRKRDYASARAMSGFESVSSVAGVACIRYCTRRPTERSGATPKVACTAQFEEFCVEYVQIYLLHNSKIIEKKTLFFQSSNVFLCSLEVQVTYSQRLSFSCFRCFGCVPRVYIVKSVSEFRHVSPNSRRCVSCRPHVGNVAWPSSYIADVEIVVCDAAHEPCNTQYVPLLRL